MGTSLYLHIVKSTVLFNLFYSVGQFHICKYFSVFFFFPQLQKSNEVRECKPSINRNVQALNKNNITIKPMLEKLYHGDIMEYWDKQIKQKANEHHVLGLSTSFNCYLHILKQVVTQNLESNITGQLFLFSKNSQK